MGKKPEQELEIIISPHPCGGHAMNFNFTGGADYFGGGRHFDDYRGGVVALSNVLKTYFDREFSQTKGEKG